jgi:hypothetical protein
MAKDKQSWDSSSFRSLFMSGASIGKEYISLLADNC